jgi:hypothetical protein
MAMTALPAFRFAGPLACFGAALLFAFTTAFAQTPDQFDKPANVRSLKPKPDDSTEIRCTTFSDLMVRETQDGPTSENAAIVRNAKAPCTAKAGPGETVLDTNGMTLDGRRGTYLLFSDLDPHGATGFVVIDVKTGKILFRDSALSHPVLQNLGLENGSLRLRYRRGVNAPCSLMANAQKCWAQLVNDKLVPADTKAPTAKICADAYARDKAPRDNPSIVVYATEVAIDAGGNVKVLSRGAIECESMP